MSEKTVDYRSPSPKPRNGPGAWVAIAILVMALFTIGLSILNDFHYRFGEGPDTGSSVLALYVTMDRLVEAHAPKGNIFIDFGKPQGIASRLARRWYFRGVYEAFPNHVWVADPSVVINDDKQVVDNNFTPDDAWLVQHHIATVFTFRNDLNNVDVRSMSDGPTTR